MSQVPEVSVTGRILSILSAFEGRSKPLSATQIASFTGIPQSTTYRMLADLVEWGALVRNPNGTFHVGLRIWELGQQAGLSQREHVIRPFLQDLFDLVHENVHMAIRQNTNALYVDKIYGSAKLPEVTRIGSKLPLHTTAVGRVLLAAEPEWFVQAYVNGKLVAPTPRTTTDPVLLLQEMKLVARQGYSLTFEQVRMGAASIAVPIVIQGQTVAAVGLVLDSKRYNELLPLLPYLQGTVERIQQALKPKGKR
jgi:DNA-binding IclR family transcriptional regulator